MLGILESLAGMRVEGGSLRVFSGAKIFDLKAQLANGAAQEGYARWARQILGERVR